MKIKLLLLALVLTLFTSYSHAQFDKPVFQLGVGIVNPDMQMRGNDYITYSSSYNYWKTYYSSTSTPPPPQTYDSIYAPTSFVFVGTDFLSKNYAAQTGFYLNGTAKINIDKYETFRLVGGLSFSSFNSFQSTRSGFIPVRYRRQLNDTLSMEYYNPEAINFDYSLSNFGLSLGFEVAPLAFTKVVSPFVGANLTFNFLSAKLSRTTGPNDSTSISFQDFRMGINLNTGLEFKVNPQWGFVIGAKYDFGNLLFKNTDMSGKIEWGRTNAKFNDEEGSYSGNIYGPLGNAYQQNIKSSKKALNWATFYIGVNFYPSMKTAPKK